MQTQQAQYPSYQEFLAFSKQEENHPSYTNLFSVHFAPPRILTNILGVQGGSKSKRLNPNIGNLRDNLNYYANSVNLPSKQMTTGSFLSVGSAIKYATGTAYSQMNISFIMPRSQYLRSFFEEWTTKISPDSNQYVEFFDDYVCPSLTIFKWERDMGGDLAKNDTSLSGYLANSKLPPPFFLSMLFSLKPFPSSRFFLTLSSGSYGIFLASAPGNFPLQAFKNKKIKIKVNILLKLFIGE